MVQLALPMCHTPIFKLLCMRLVTRSSACTQLVPRTRHIRASTRISSMEGGVDLQPCRLVSPRSRRCSSNAVVMLMQWAW